MDLTQVILKGLGKAKVKAILNKWIKAQINLNLEYGQGEWKFDCTISGYGLPEVDEDYDYYVDDLFEFIGNKI
jgi:hypothetical protein